MIVAADWIFPVTSPPLRRSSIVIENGRIRELRPLSAGDPDPTGICVIPGLINTHTHLAYTCFRNLLDEEPFFSWIRKLTKLKYEVLKESDFEASTKTAIDEMLSAGITTVADLSDIQISLKSLSESPLRGIFYWEFFGVEKEQAEKTWNLLPEKFRELKKYETDRLRIGLSPHACYTVRPELYSKVSEWALGENIPVSFHVAESKEEEQFIANRTGPIGDFLKDRAADWKILGASSIEHLAATGIFKTRPIVAHGVQASDQDLKILADADVAISHCPKSNSKFGHGIAPVCSMLDHGIRLGIGSDSAASNNRFDLFEEARFALLLQRCRENAPVLSEQKMLELITIGGARAMKMDHFIGSLEPGKFADLAMVRMPTFYKEAVHVLHHLIHNTTASDVRQTVIDGEIVFKSEM